MDIAEHNLSWADVSIYGELVAEDIRDGADMRIARVTTVLLLPGKM